MAGLIIRATTLFEDSSQQAAENALAIAVQSELLMSVLRTSSLPTTPTSFPSSTTGNV